jgi:Stage II sporulation protein M
MERFFKTKRAFVILFLIIFSLNNLSLFTSFLSGFLVILPPLAAFITGLNVSIVSFELMGWKGIWQILINPVAWLEFPAAWLSFAMGFRLAETILTRHSFQLAIDEFTHLLPVYLKYVLTLLFVAALLEAGMIVFAEKLNNGN